MIGTEGGSGSGSGSLDISPSSSAGASNYAGRDQILESGRVYYAPPVGNNIAAEILAMQGTAQNGGRVDISPTRIAALFDQVAGKTANESKNGVNLLFIGILAVGIFAVFMAARG